VRESEGVIPRIPNPGTRWNWVISFTPRPLYPWGKSPFYPSKGGTSTKSTWQHSVEENFLAWQARMK